MKIMTSIPVLFVLLDLISIGLCYSWAHTLLNDFLVGGAGRSSAKRIRKNRTVKNKIFLNDMNPILENTEKSLNGITGSIEFGYVFGYLLR
ncbi:MAG: hypothetical protein ACLT2D_01610 [Oscillospiraceae bacterium]